MMRGARLALAALFLAPSCGQDVTLGGDAPPPCQSQPCGTPCTIDLCAGAPPAKPCGAPAVLGYCDSDGSCNAGPLACVQCLGQPCGAPCMPAPPMMVPPGAFACDDHGQCVPNSFSCTPPYDPCLGKTCGQPCTLCDPMDPMCIGGPPRVCDPTATCVLGPLPPMCP
jgi:hypothetical protein